MKLLLLYTVLSLLCVCAARAQNMTPNGSFEANTACPTFVSQMSNSTGWQSFHTGNSDYFHTCAASSTTINVPANFAGYQTPADGDAYAGFYTSQGFNYKEYISRAISSLTIGDLYEVSLSVNKANKSEYATADIGVWFYDRGPSTSLPTLGYLPVTPQVSYKGYGYISDTVNWIRVRGAFIADSAYDNMVIGGFGDPFNTQPRFVAPYAFGLIGSYYYIDSVVVRPVNLTYKLYDTAFCVGDSIIVPYLIKRSKYQPANVFSLQLSDATGSFATAVVIASVTADTAGTLRGVIPTTTAGSGYRLRLLSTNIADTAYTSNNISIGGTKPAKPIASIGLPICELDTMKLYASSTTLGVSYTWNGPDTFWSRQQNPRRNTTNVSYGGRYIVSAWLGACASHDTLQVTVVPTSGLISATSNSPVCQNDTLRLSVISASPGITDIKWGLPNGTASGGKDTILAPFDATSGIYTAFGKTGLCFAKTNINVQIKPIPPNFKLSANTLICEGDELNVLAPRTIGGMSFLWAGPAGYTSTQQNLKFAPVLMAQNGRFLCVATTNGCSVRDSIDIEVRPTIGLITNTSNSPICEGDTLKLFGEAHAPNNSGFLWIAPNGVQYSSKDTFVAPATRSNAGKYILFSNFNNCAASDTLEVSVKSYPDTFTAISNSPVCNNDTLKLKVNAATGITAYSWKGPGGFISSSKDTLILQAAPTNAGTYIVTGFYNGCDVRDTIVVKVNPLPGAVAIANGPLCEGDLLDLTGTATLAGASFSWAGPDGFKSSSSVATINAVKLANAGQYTLTTILDGCTNKDTVELVVNTLPVKPDAAGNTPVKEGDILKLVINNPETGANYSWSGPAGFISTMQDPVLNKVTTANTGTYIVVVRNNRCSNSDSVNVIVTTTSDSSYIMVYPNASNGNFTIHATTLRDQQVPIVITASNGQLVYSAEAATTNKLLHADIKLKDVIASGVYTLKVIIDGKSYSMRISVVR